MEVYVNGSIDSVQSAVDFYLKATSKNDITDNRGMRDRFFAMFKAEDYERERNFLSYRERVSNDYRIVDNASPVLQEGEEVYSVEGGFVFSGEEVVEETFNEESSVCNESSQVGENDNNLSSWGNGCVESDEDEFVDYRCSDEDSLDDDDFINYSGEDSISYYDEPSVDENYSSWGNYDEVDEDISSCSSDGVENSEDDDFVDYTNESTEVDDGDDDFVDYSPWGSEEVGDIDEDYSAWNNDDVDDINEDYSSWGNYDEVVEEDYSDCDGIENNDNEENSLGGNNKEVDEGYSGWEDYFDDCAFSSNLELDKNNLETENTVLEIEKNNLEIENTINVSDSMNLEIEKNNLETEKVDKIESTSSNSESDIEVPSDLREFVKVYHNCDMAFALKYFTKKEIDKQLSLGRVFKRKNKLLI